MITNKRRFHTIAALSVLGPGSEVVALFRLKNADERQIAEDSRIISKNPHIIFAQVTREVEEVDFAVDRV